MEWTLHKGDSSECLRVAQCGDETGADSLAKGESGARALVVFGVHSDPALHALQSDQRWPCAVQTAFTSRGQEGAGRPLAVAQSQ